MIIRRVGTERREHLLFSVDRVYVFLTVLFNNFPLQFHPASFCYASNKVVKTSKSKCTCCSDV